MIQDNWFSLADKSWGQGSGLLTQSYWHQPSKLFSFADSKPADSLLFKNPGLLIPNQLMPFCSNVQVYWFQISWYPSFQKSRSTNSKSADTVPSCSNVQVYWFQISWCPHVQMTRFTDSKSADALMFKCPGLLIPNQLMPSCSNVQVYWFQISWCPYVQMSRFTDSKSTDTILFIGSDLLFQSSWYSPVQMFRFTDPKQQALAHSQGINYSRREKFRSGLPPYPPPLSGLGPGHVSVKWRGCFSQLSGVKHVGLPDMGK
jgi:hypothetical protein